MRKLMTGIAAAAMAASMGMTSLAGNVRNLLEQQVGQLQTAWSDIIGRICQMRISVVIWAVTARVQGDGNEANSFI